MISSTAGTRFKTLGIQNDLHLLDASVRHLGTDINYIVLENLYAMLKDKAELERLYRLGAERATAVASRTLSKVHKKLGFAAR